MRELVAEYLRKMRAKRDTGATQPEQSYYPEFDAFLTDAAAILGYGQAQVIPQPQHNDYGVPDFQVQSGTLIMGWAEAKPLGGPLNHNTDQLKQYRSALHNLIFTNYLRFQLFENGDLLQDVVIARDIDATPSADAILQLEALLRLFFAQSAPSIRTASELAAVLAMRARFLRQAVADLYRADAPALVALHNAYEQFLYSDIGEDDFYDLVAQTIVYTLFSAWTGAPQGQFSLDRAASYLPPNVPLLKDLFTLTVSNPDLANTAVALHVAGVVAVLSGTDSAVLKVRQEGRLHEDVGNDPVMYFYEPFLHAYSPKIARVRGIYYTPLPAVRAMVRLADGVIRDKFDRPAGMADKQVYVLDPATGTGTFLVETARQVAENAQGLGDRDSLDAYLRGRFIANSYGFEFLAAPYTIAHLKLTRALQADYGFDLAAGERFKVYLTNTLQNPGPALTPLPGLTRVAEEARLAGVIKTQQPLLLIIGNPPYSGDSENLNVVLDGLDAIEPLKWCDGARIENTKWLNNDYVKFLRWAQWRVTQAEAQTHGGAAEHPAGMVVFITDSSYLASPTFRGLRRLLLAQFDTIYIINLHGRSRGGSDQRGDQNIFDIQQGVCILVCVRNGGGVPAGAPQADRHLEANDNALLDPRFLALHLPPETVPRLTGRNRELQEMSRMPLRATVHYVSSGHGSRAHKYAWLDELTWLSVEDSPAIVPEPPFYFLQPFDRDVEYWRWPSLKNLFAESGMCVTTARDGLVTHFTRPELEARMRRFAEMDADEAKVELGLHDTTDWTVQMAQVQVGRQNIEAMCRPYLFRPFDVRWIYYSGAVVKRPVEELFGHVDQTNPAILAIQTSVKDEPYRYAYISAEVANKKVLSTEANCYAFPLYANDAREGQGVLRDLADDARRGNVAQTLLDQFSAAYGRQVSAEEVFHYTYAVLNAAPYRQTYHSQLMTDFPRIPFPRAEVHFARLGLFGRQLADAHLLGLTQGLTIPLSGTDYVVQAREIRYSAAEQCVYINGAGSRFSGITPAMWGYHIGSYRPLERWLRERAGRRFVLDYTAGASGQVRIEDYRRVVRAVAAALALHSEIDAAWDQMAGGR